MRVAGVVAEYNPFHNGHAWQIRALRALGFDAVVCVCSPSVVQRGEAALFPAPVRTRAALVGGADLVVSLPAPYATASAELFAAAGIWLLTALGCVECVAFGAEADDVAALERAAQALRQPAFEPLLRAQLNAGKPLPAARAAALEQLCPSAARLLETPNNILAVEYCKALASLREEGCPGVPRALALPRVGAAHDAPLGAKKQGGQALSATSPACTQQAAQGVYLPSAPATASATALGGRGRAPGGGAKASYVPAACLAVYREAERDGARAEEQAFSVAVLSRLRAQDARAFSRIRGTREGLENRLFSAVQNAGSLDALCDALRTKRYPTARLRRYVLDAALGYTDELPARPPYLHILGATKTGLAVLQWAKGVSPVPMDQSLARLRGMGCAQAQVARAHAAAEDLTALCLAAPQPCGTAYTQKMQCVFG